MKRYSSDGKKGRKGAGNCKFKATWAKTPRHRRKNYDCVSDGDCYRSVYEMLITITPSKKINFPGIFITENTFGARQVSEDGVNKNPF